jgi:hypothetical protein
VSHKKSKKIHTAYGVIPILVVFLLSISRDRAVGSSSGS